MPSSMPHWVAIVSNRFLFVYAALGSDYPVWANDPDNLLLRTNIAHHITEYVTLTMMCTQRKTYYEAIEAYRRSPHNLIKRVIQKS